MCGGTISSHGSEGCSDVIDFKYHMVSLVAVFLALAVGIILGAGPLRGQLSQALEKQVTEIGDERNVLRERVDVAQQRADDKDTLLDSLLPGAVAGTLTDRRVTLVEMPGADTAVADELAGALSASGAQVVARTAIERTWMDAETTADRQSAAAELLPTFTGLDPAIEATPEALLATVLAGPKEVDDVLAWSQAEGRLNDLGGIDTDRPTGEVGAVPQTPAAVAPEVVVVISGGIDAASLATDSTATAGLAIRLAIVSALAEQDVPTVVIGGGAESYADPQSVAEDPLVAAVRGSMALDNVVSSVDNIESPAGLIAATWATGLVIDGDQGHYGVAADAQSPAPPVPPAREPATEPPTP